MDTLPSIATNFLVGGAVVSSVSVFATWLNPVAGAIWWSFPFTIIPSVYFMRYHGRSNQEVSKFLRSTTFGLGLLVISLYALSYYFKRLEPYDEHWWLAIVKGASVWAVCSVIFYIVYTRM